LLEKSAIAAVPHAEDRRKFISEAFHSFHQPLTALHCGLELVLLKERTEQEYRERVDDALGNAGAILKLNKAVRELVEAADAGENVGCVSVKSLLTQVTEELTFVGDAGVVTVKAICSENGTVEADSWKLKTVLSNVAAALVRSAVPGSIVRLEAHPAGAMICISAVGEGERHATADQLERKLELIRIDTARSYAWALGGDFTVTQTGFELRLPLVK
jgi:signal transduction histidine kinase